MLLLELLLELLVELLLELLLELLVQRLVQGLEAKERGPKQKEACAAAGIALGK